MIVAWLLVAASSVFGAGRDRTDESPVSAEHFDYIGNPTFLPVVTHAVERVRERLATLVDDTLPYKPSIYIADDPARFKELIGGRFPDWGAAAAFPERKLIAIKSPETFNINRSLEELLAHEYAHLVTAHAAGFHTAPRWLEEGLSMYVSMEWSWSDNLAMSKAAVFGQHISLRDIEQVNRFGEGKAHVAYAEAYLAITYLIDNYTDRAIRVLLSETASGSSAEKALYEATGSSYDEFEADFRAHLNNRFNVLSLFMDTIFFWLALAVILIIGAFLKFRKRREYYRKWEQEERLHSTDFDYGDPDRPEEIDDDEPWRN